MAVEMGKSQIRFWAGRKNPIYYLSIYLSSHIMKAQRYIIKLQTGGLYDNKVHKALLNQAKIVSRTQILFLALSLYMREFKTRILQSLCFTNIQLTAQIYEPKRSYWLQF